MTPTRRSFITGLGASLTALAIPVAALSAPARTLPAIKLKDYSYQPATISHFVKSLRELYAQAQALQTWNPTRAELETMATQIDEELKWVVPATILLVFETPIETMLREDFAFTTREEPYGVVVIS